MEEKFDLPVFTIDAFADEPFCGNPAAVCLVPKGKTFNDDMLQRIASEMNLSETAYVEHLEDAPDNSSFKTSNTFRLRWFTPTNEVPLCGHATLASAATLFYCADNSCDTITFLSKSGPLIAKRCGKGITLDFPINPVQPFDRHKAAALEKEICDPALLQEVYYSPGTKKLLIRLKDTATRETLESISPDARALQNSDKTGDIMGVIVTIKGDASVTDKRGKSYDFMSRYFAPWNGIPEDPVTGSAHTVLAHYWQQQLGKEEFYARQCSKRGGDLNVKIVSNGRVELTGNARVVLTGTLKL